MWSSRHVGVAQEAGTSPWSTLSGPTTLARRWKGRNQRRWRQRSKRKRRNAACHLLVSVGGLRKLHHQRTDFVDARHDAASTNNAEDRAKRLKQGNTMDNSREKAQYASPNKTDACVRRKTQIDTRRSSDRCGETQVHTGGQHSCTGRSTSGRSCEGRPTSEISRSSKQNATLPSLSSAKAPLHSRST